MLEACVVNSVNSLALEAPRKINPKPNNQKLYNSELKLADFFFIPRCVWEATVLISFHNQFHNEFVDSL